MPTLESDMFTASSAAEVLAPDPGSGDAEPQLDANKLHVYAVALELHTLCSTLVSSLNRIVRDQLERASLSVVLNIAEAGGRRSRRDKARYYMIARGSATEVAALFDVLERRRLASPAALTTGRRLAIRAVQMLTRLGQRLSS
jgi:four helix bundle protein